MTRLDAIRRKHPAVADETTILIYKRDLRDLLDLVDALRRERDCRRYGAETTTTIDAIRDTDKVLSRLDADEDNTR